MEKLKQEILEILKKYGLCNINHIIFDLTQYKYVFYDCTHDTLVLYTDIMKVGVYIAPKIYYLEGEIYNDCTQEDLEELRLRMDLRVLTNEMDYEKIKKVILNTSGVPSDELH